MNFKHSLTMIAILLFFTETAATDIVPSTPAPSVLSEKDDTSSGPALDDNSAERVADVADVETVETVETVDVASTQDLETVSSPSDASSQDSKANVLIVAGRLHPAFVHLPLGLLIALLLFEIFSAMETANGRFSVMLWGVTVSAFLPAIISGLLRAQEILTMGGQMDASLHRNLMLAAFFLLVLATTLRAGCRKKYTANMRVVCIGLISGATLLGFLGAHHGGKLVYGADFLPF